MNESGFIGKFMPDFGRIVAMMQFDMYHSYTVDEHTIFAMGILNGIETGGLADIAPVATAAVKEITLRRELCVALLLHDIAKGVVVIIPFSAPRLPVLSARGSGSLLRKPKLSPG